MTVTTKSNMASAIISNVVRGLMYQQADEYAKARSILNAFPMPEQTQEIVGAEPAVVAALYACLYDHEGYLRRDEQGRPLSREYLESKLLNLKANPHREPTAMMLRGVFMDLRARMGNEYRKSCREIGHILRQAATEEKAA